MDRYGFKSNYLRTGNHPHYCEIYNPITSTDLIIDVLVEEQDLRHLVRLIPNIKKLKLIFCDSHVKYDLKPLTLLHSLKELHIEGLWGKTKVLNISSLTKLNLNILVLHGENLDPNNPTYQWPQVRKSEYDHIIEIINYPDMIFYDIEDNIILQNINGNYYEIIKCNGSIILIPIFYQDFCDIVDKHHTGFIPENDNDLYQEDNEN